jgi:hypothetical protein
MTADLDALYGDELSDEHRELLGKMLAALDVGAFDNPTDPDDLGSPDDVFILKSEDAFKDMLRRGRALSEAQVTYLKKVAFALHV